MRQYVALSCSLSVFMLSGCQETFFSSRLADSQTIPASQAKPFSGPVLVCSTYGFFFEASLQELEKVNVLGRAMQIGSREIQTVPGSIVRESINAQTVYKFEFVPPVDKIPLQVMVAQDSNGTLSLKSDGSFPDAEICKIEKNQSSSEQVVLFNEWMSNRYSLASEDPGSPANYLVAWASEMGLSPNPNVPNPAERFVPVKFEKLPDTISRCLFLTRSEPSYPNPFLSDFYKRVLDTEYLGGLGEIQRRTANSLRFYEVPQFLLDNSIHFDANECSLVIEIPAEKRWFFVHSVATRND